MLDIKFVRENPEIVKENIKKKFQDHKLGYVDEVIALDEERRETIVKADELRANLDPAKYTGRSVSQVEEFLRDFVKPVLDRIYEAPVESVLNV